MKKIIILLVFAIGYCGLSQTKTTKDSDFLISYQLDYKKFITSETNLSANTILIVTNQGSLFTFEAMMNLDKIQQEREITIDEALLNRPPFYFLIKSDSETTVHYEEIGSDTYNFKEKLNQDWELINQDTLISGYSCKKAMLNYAGRKWSAWYTPEIPIAVGPYKFHGLPGLIMNIKDSKDVFNFTVSEIKKGNFVTDSKIENYFVKDGARPFENIDINEFYKIRGKFFKMSLNEGLQYMNRDELAKPTYLITDLNGEKVRVNTQPKTRNFIELVE